MAKPCEICGDVGYAGFIGICSLCQETRLHPYCMPNFYEGDLEKWVCDECRSSTKTPLPSPVLSKPIEGSKISYSTIKKLPMKSKVQFLPPEEAMVLKSGEPKTKFSPSKTTVKKTLPPSCSMKPFPRAVPPATRKPFKRGSIPRSSSNEELVAGVKKKPVTPTRPARNESTVDIGWSSKSAQTYYGTKENVAGSSKHVCCGTTVKPRPSGELLNSSTERKTNGAKRSIQDLYAASSGPAKHVYKGITANQVVQGLETPSLGKRPAKHVFQGTTSKSLPSEEILKTERGPQFHSNDALALLPFSELQELIMEKIGDDVCDNTQQKIIDAELSESSKVAIKFEKSLPNHPAESPTWRGNFHVTSNAFYGLYDGIIAHPPFKVHKKVFELSKQLPGLLQFQLFPRSSLWLELFDEDIPSAVDIGLYFFPSKSCEKLYFSLVERLNKRDMFLKSCINGIELLVFSSKNLEDGCKTINQRCFLWGVFRSCEDRVMGDKEISPDIAAPADDEVCGMEEDMEVDMVGGQEMDNVDKVVSKSAQPMLDATLPVKIKEEVPSPGDFTNDNVAKDLTSYIERCFERELQKSFDRFEAYVKGNGLQAVKIEK